MEDEDAEYRDLTDEERTAYDRLRGSQGLAQELNGRDGTVAEWVAEGIETDAGDLFELDPAACTATFVALANGTAAAALAGADREWCPACRVKGPHWHPLPGNEWSDGDANGPESVYRDHRMVSVMDPNGVYMQVYPDVTRAEAAFALAVRQLADDEEDCEPDGWPGDEDGYRTNGS